MSFPNNGLRLHGSILPWALLLALAPLYSSPSTAALVRTVGGALIAEHSGQCLDVRRIAGTTEAVSQWDCMADATRQQWTIQRSQGAYLVVNAWSKRCLSVAGGTPSDGAAIVEAACSAAGRFWDIRTAGNGLQLVARSSTLCAKIQDASRTRAATLVLGACNAIEHNQRFVVGGGFVAPETDIQLIGKRTGLCAALPTTGTAALQQACDTSLNTQWKLQPYGNNASYYRIVAGSTGACLAVDTAGLASGAVPPVGTRLVSAPCSGQAAELWTPLAQVASSSYVLKSRLSTAAAPRCLDIAGESLATGAALVVNSTCAPALTARWTLAYPGSRATWGNLINVPTVPVGIANLPDGRILGWSAYQREYFTSNDVGKRTYTFILDPTTGDWIEHLLTETKHDMFCPGTSNLPDGRIMISGGSTWAATSLFDPSATLDTAWSRSFPTATDRGGDMNITRAYQANTVLSNGNVFTLGGSWAGGVGNKHGELYSVANNAWQPLPGVPLPNESDFIYPDPAEGIYRGDNHMWLFAQSDGWVFHAGPSVQMHWIDTKNGGNVIAAGPRGDDAPSINGNAVLYDIGRILKLGGAYAYIGGLSYKNAYLIDIRKRPAVTVTSLAPTNYGRVFSNSVVLPNGEVIVIGGQTRAKLFTDQYGVFETELWDPKTQVFTQLNAPIAVARNYHSTALLLQDGRVLSGGGGLCGTGCVANHPDVQILTPPYLFNPDGSTATRPVITQAPSTVAVGKVVTFDTDGPIAEVDMVRMSSTTHTVANDQRRMRLPLTSTTVANRYRATVPADRGVALPGYWMLFALNAQGVPSVARTIKVQ